MWYPAAARNVAPKPFLRRSSSNVYDVKDADAALESFNPVRKARKEKSSSSAIVRTRSDILPSVSQRQLQRKRTSEVGVGFTLARDEHKRKNRRIDLTGLARVLGNRSYEDDRVLLNPGKRSKNDDFQEHEGEAWQEVQNQEFAEEKEREKTLQNEFQKREEAIEKALRATDEEEKERRFRDAQKAEKKAKFTSQLLQGGTPSKDIREVTPHTPSLKGGTMSSFQMSDDIPHETGKKRSRTGARLKKTKEQKQAEKDAAAAVQAAIDRGDELPAIAPKEEARLEALKSRSQTEDSTRQQLLSGTYETGAVGISKETEPVLRIKYTISEDMTKGEQARNKARFSAIADRPRILGSKRSSVLGFAHGRTGIEAHCNHGTLLLKDRSGFSVPFREVLQKSVASDTNRPVCLLECAHHSNL